MILTVTLNASMDKKYIINDFNYDNTNRVMECENTADGKGLNISRVIRLLGGDVLATGIVGGNVGNLFFPNSINKA